MKLDLTLFDENFRNLLGILFDQLRINFFAIDKDGYYIARNNTLTEIVGQTERADKVEPKAWQSCLEVMSTGKHEMIEEEYKNRWYLSFKAPLLEHGKTIGVIGVSVDITDRKQAELAKKEFIENMSHDLRTPFSGILSLSEYLHGKEDDPVKKEFLGEIMKSGKWLLTLLNEVLEMSMLGSHPLNLTEFSLLEVVHQVAELLQAEVRHKELELNISCPEMMLNSDKMRITRILLNLVGNAVKYTDKGSISIKVSTHSPLQISVEDTGKGIPADGLETIFNRFTKLRPSYEQQGFTGAGVGLHIAREFARDLGGDITVTSEVGKGSCFTLLLKN